MGTTPHTALRCNTLPVEVCMSGGGGLSPGTFSPAEFIFLHSFLQHVWSFLSAQTWLAAPKSGHRRHCRLQLCHQLVTGKLSIYRCSCEHCFTVSATTDILAILKGSLDEWLETKMLNCQSSSICGLFYLQAEISPLSCFRLHHFACPIELD